MKEEEVRHYMPGYHWYLGYESFRYDNGEKIAVSKEEFTYADDFNPESEYYNPAYTEGSDEWNNSISGHLDYYYSARESSGVTAPEMTEDAVIVDRFDLTGQRLTAPVKGINIVVYSDGTVTKMMVK